MINRECWGRLQIGHNLQRVPFDGRYDSLVGKIFGLAIRADARLPCSALWRRCTGSKWAFVQAQPLSRTGSDGLSQKLNELREAVSLLVIGPCGGRGFRCPDPVGGFWIARHPRDNADGFPDIDFVEPSTA